jgi:N utilization substance protein A
MRSDFMLAINQLCAERKLPVDTVKAAVEAALISAYKRNFGAVTNVEVEIEPNTGTVRVYAVKDVVETVEDSRAQVSLAEAQCVNPGAAIGEVVRIESTPRDFGRIAAQAAKQVILQRIREAERDIQYSTFIDREGEIAHGTIQSFDLHSKDVMVNLDGAEAVLPFKEQVPTERYRRGGRVRAYVLEVRKGSRGPQITLTRRSQLFLRRLLELEVPEIANGLVEIKNIAREAGSRSKVAVHATQEGVDPIGSCVGVRGGRIQNVVNELGGEKIDVVQWNADISLYIANALSPAKVMNVLPDDNSSAGRTATVIVPDRQLSLAIGKEGQNARLAAKLTGWRIDIKSATEAAEETLGRLEDTTVPPEEMDLLTLAEVILRKRTTVEPTEEEQTLIQKALVEGAEEDLAWPEREPQGTEPVSAGSLDKPAMERVEPTEVVSEVEAPDGGPVRPRPVIEEALSEEEEAVEGFIPSSLWPMADEQIPTFDGEQVEQSSGWVQAEPQENLYSGWENELDGMPGADSEWEREELEEPEGAQIRGPKKKKKKKVGKPRPQHPRGDR